MTGTVTIDPLGHTVALDGVATILAGNVSLVGGAQGVKSFKLSQHWEGGTVPLHLDPVAYRPGEEGLYVADVTNLGGAWTISYDWQLDEIRDDLHREGGGSYPVYARPKQLILDFASYPQSVLVRFDSPWKFKADNLGVDPSIEDRTGRTWAILTLSLSATIPEPIQSGTALAVGQLSFLVLRHRGRRQPGHGEQRVEK